MLGSDLIAPIAVLSEFLVATAQDDFLKRLYASLSSDARAKPTVLSGRADSNSLWKREALEDRAAVAPVPGLLPEAESSFEQLTSKQHATGMMAQVNTWRTCLTKTFVKLRDTEAHIAGLCMKKCFIKR